jgi:hypothetical protein
MVFGGSRCEKSWNSHASSPSPLNVTLATTSVVALASGLCFLPDCRCNGVLFLCLALLRLAIGILRYTKSGKMCYVFKAVKLYMG